MTEFEQKIKELERKNFDLQYENVVKNSRITDLEKIVAGHLQGTPQQQKQQSNEQKISGLGSGLPQHILDYITGKTNNI